MNIQSFLVSANTPTNSLSGDGSGSSTDQQNATIPSFSDLLRASAANTNQSNPASELDARIQDYVATESSPEKIAAFLLQNGAGINDLSRVTGSSAESLADYAVRHKTSDDNSMRVYLRELGYAPAQSNFFDASNGIAPNALAIDLQDRPDLWGHLNETADLGLTKEQLDQGWASGTGAITDWLASLSPTQYAKLNDALYQFDKSANFTGTTYGSPLAAQEGGPDSVSKVWLNPVTGYNPALGRDVAENEYTAGLNRFGSSLPVFDNRSQIGDPNGRHLTWQQQDELVRKTYGVA